MVGAKDWNWERAAVRVWLAAAATRFRNPSWFLLDAAHSTAQSVKSGGSLVIVNCKSVFFLFFL